MALTPINYAVVTEQSQTETVGAEIQPSKTWRIDLNSGRIRGHIDGEEAVRQYIRKALMTARNRYLIYDDTYGEEVRELIGENLSQELMDVEMPRLVREAIEYDDRIESVTNVEVTQYNSDSVHIAVTVELVSGVVITEEVAI